MTTPELFNDFFVIKFPNDITEEEVVQIRERLRNRQQGDYWVVPKTWDIRYIAPAVPFSGVCDMLDWLMEQREVTT